MSRPALLHEAYGELTKVRGGAGRGANCQVVNQPLGCDPKICQAQELLAIGMSKL